VKVSVITAVHNGRSTIQHALDSVHAQSGCEVEHIVVDGMSSDGTDQVIDDNRPRISQVIREPDQGCYDAMNKGIAAATGDIIGFLHADDMLAKPSSLGLIRDTLQTGNFDAVYGDLLYVRTTDPSHIVRYWRAGSYRRTRFWRGWMPPHPTVYVRKQVYQALGGYLTDFGSAADYECLVRLMVKHEIKVGYVPKILVKMRLGGASNASLGNRFTANRSDRQAWLENELRPPFGLRISKPISKLPQYWQRPGPTALAD
jgi:glycosyltransferase